MPADGRRRQLLRMDRMESTSSAFDREPGGVPLPPPSMRDRDGLSALERKALYRVHTELPAMPASLVVQILLWPEKITDWARDESVTPALVYNMLGGFKPYHGLRERLAQRLGVTKGAVDHLIDARRQQPSTRRIPEPPDGFGTDDVSLVSPEDSNDPARSLPHETGSSGADGDSETLTSDPRAAPSTEPGPDENPAGGTDDSQTTLPF